MSITRRRFGLGASALTLTACVGTAPGPVDRGRAALPADLRPHSNPGYDAWVAAFRARAERDGLSASTLDAGFRGTG